MNHKLGLVLKADPPTCWNTRRTSGGCVGLLFAQTTQNRMIWMNEVMKMAVDGISLLLTSSRTTIFVICYFVIFVIFMWCVKWVIVIVGQSRHACRCRWWNSALLHLLLLSPPGWWYSSRMSYYIWGKIALHLEKSATSCTTVLDRCIWTPPFFYFRGITDEIFEIFQSLVSNVSTCK